MSDSNTTAINTDYFAPVHTQTWVNGRHNVRCVKMIHETWDHLKLVKLCNSVVYKYLKNHEKSSVRELADEFKRIVPIQNEGTIPTFQEVSDGFRFCDNNNVFKR